MQCIKLTLHLLAKTWGMSFLVNHHNYWLHFSRDGSSTPLSRSPCQWRNLHPTQERFSSSAWENNVFSTEKSFRLWLPHVCDHCESPHVSGLSQGDQSSLSNRVIVKWLCLYLWGSQIFSKGWNHRIREWLRLERTSKII